MTIIEAPNRPCTYGIFKKHGIGAELGVHCAVNARDLFRVAEPSKLYLVDNWIDYFLMPGSVAEYLARANVRDFNHSNIVEIRKEHSVSFLKTFPDEFFDWIYIDDDHTNIKEVITVAGPKVKIGGHLAGHDLAVVPKWWGTVTMRAILEQVQSGYGDIVCISNEEMPDWVIERKV